MSRTKQEVIRNIADEFIKKLTEDYFTGKRPQIEGIIKTNDFSRVNRLLDKVTLSEDISKEYFDLTLSSPNPVTEILEPLVIEISNRMFSGWYKTDLKEDIKGNIPRYAELISQARDTSEFQTTWLRAIAAACTSILADKLTAELEVMQAAKATLVGDSENIKARRSELEDRMLSTSKKFTNDVSKPFDTYTKNIQSPILLYPTWLRVLCQAFLNIMSFFHKNLSIEEKVDGLYLAAEAAQEKIKAYLSTLGEKDIAAQTLLTTFNQTLVDLKAKLSNLASEIQSKKEEGMAYEDDAQKDFNIYAQNFAKFLRAQQAQLPDTELANHRVLKEVINTLLRGNPVLAEQVIERIETPTPNGIELTSLSSSSHSTEALSDDEKSEEGHRSGFGGSNSMK